MATGPNPTYDPSTGQLTYADGRVVDHKAPRKSNTMEAAVQENVTGRLGCCSKVYSYAIPTDLLRRAFCTGMTAMEVRDDPSIIVTLRGDVVEPPVEFSTSQIMMAAQTAVRWGVFPQSPFLRSHAEYMTTEAFEEWLAENPPPNSYAREDVPTANVQVLKDWVNSGVDDDDRLARALIGREVEEDRDPPRSTALDFLNAIIDGETPDE